MAHEYAHPTVTHIGAQAPPHAPPRQPQSITALERLEHTSDALCGAIAELSDYLAGLTTPPELHIVRFSAAQLRWWDQGARVAPSVGFFNPNAFSVWAGIGGQIPDGSASGALEITGNSLLVWPAAVQDLELGVKAADIAAGTAFVHVLRFWTVQPASFGAWK